MTGSNYMVELAYRAARHLEGTCGALYGLGDEFDAAQDNTDFCATLDRLVFECSSCNWWFSQAENGSRDGAQWECQECVSEREEA